ncbi:rhodanese-related sulfurtransferase [Cyanobium sp. Copco_Reservoir_LC18]|uniref:sulfurtransferase n=1 Tax=Cyanobium sp. Copco_Reservoir_LC18 TaxID=1328305 RepID=UPI00135AF9F8|nr:sulfurtransferase [Cyanobium sp. Copco_Reservoir_LC18]KAF0654506.1 rhodanese-related sulfurtransferase [Cyanobium sp. Copco_Reservoir_LC18]
MLSRISRPSRRLFLSVAAGAATTLVATGFAFAEAPITRALAAAPAQASAGVTTLAAGGTTLQVLSPEEAAAAARSGRWKVLDVRPVPPLSYVGGHIPGAVHLSEQAFRGPNGRLPFQIWTPTKLAGLLSQAGISNRDSVLVYSDGNDVLGTALVSYILEKSGVRQVAIVDGGLSGYKAAGQSTTKAFPSFQAASFRPTTVQGLAITLDELKPLIGRRDVVIIDPRPKAQFEGTDQTFIRNGHIPGARNIPWQAFTEANNADEAKRNPHRLKSLEEIRALLVSRGITPDKTIIVSCSTGREASLQFLALRHLLRYPNVRIYEGSWTEYSATNLPIAVGPEGSPAQQVSLR